MKAIVVDRVGAPEVMKFVTVADPVIDENEVLVETTAAGVNFVDVQYRSGVYSAQLPFIPGVEGAGHVVAVGSAVSGVEVGHRVAWPASSASYAELVAVPAATIMLLSDAISDAQAMGLSQGLTAQCLARSVVDLKPGSTALVHASAGGVGLILAQILKLIGVRVVGTTSSAEKAAVAKRHGVDHVVNYAEYDFVEACREWTDGMGVDVVFDGVGAETVIRGLETLKACGTMVNYGYSSGLTPPIDVGLLAEGGSLSLTRPRLLDFISTPEERDWRLKELVDWIETGAVEIVIGGTYPLAEASVAHRALEGRQTVGKLYLTTHHK